MNKNPNISLNMEFEFLNKAQIFPIPAGDFFNRQEDHYYLIYAPLANAMMMASKENVIRLNEKIQNPERLKEEDDLKEHLLELTDAVAPEQRIQKINSPGDLQKLSILPTHKCNFNCSYCYASKGRSDVVLSEEKLLAGLKYFIDPQRTESRFLSISFIGGGEPLLAWPLVKKGIIFASELAAKTGFKLSITLITNGSIMNWEIIEVLKKYQVLPDISFDILPEIQNRQRSNYIAVCKTLDMLSDNGFTPSLNATITPDNVMLQEEMVREALKKFPCVENMIFEPVVAPELFDEPKSLAAFYNTFIEHFFKARNLAAMNNRLVECRIIRNMEEILDRGCPSKFSITPQGDIAICYCASSPNEPNYQSRVYGSISHSGIVSLDQQKFLKTHLDNLFSRRKCDYCFARWHCGGGCMCPNELYNDAYLEEVCIFTRKIIKQELLHRFENRYAEMYGFNIKQAFSN